MSGEFLGTIRASAWPNIFDCALRFYYQSIEHRWKPPTGAQRIGTGWHAATAAYDRARMDGSPISIDDAAGVYVDELKRDADSVQWELPRREAEAIGLTLTQRYCSQIAPTRRYAGVEVLCESLDIETPHGVLRVTGTTDRIRIDPDEREGISDGKTGKRAVEGIREGRPRAAIRGAHLQLGVYVLMAEHATGRRMEAPAEIIGGQTAKTNPVVAVGRIADVRTPLIGTPERPGLISIAAGMLKSGIFPPNPRSQLCSKRYCGGWDVCPYHSRDVDDEDNEPDSL